MLIVLPNKWIRDNKGTRILVSASYSDLVLGDMTVDCLSVLEGSATEIEGWDREDRLFKRICKRYAGRPIAEWISIEDDTIYGQARITEES
jgi:hypothetical protein